MNEFIKTDDWRIIEERFDPSRVKSSESLFSLGNGVMGGRANFEEAYSGESLQGNYIGAVYYPDKTRVGWWKNGYPEYFAKVLNSAFWIGIHVKIDGEMLDLAKVAQVSTFRRELDMRHGILRRKMRVEMQSGAVIEVEATRFPCLARRETAVIEYAVTPVNRAMQITFEPYIDADVRNTDSNYDEKFWEHVSTDTDCVQMRTKKSGFEVAWAQRVSLDGAQFRNCTTEEHVQASATVEKQIGERAVLHKYVGICSSLNHTPAQLQTAARTVASEAFDAGFERLLDEQSHAWEAKWHSCDIAIEGDSEAQQGIRFCIFMLLQTYTGVDTRLNIGPKGFTGEKYGGVTYWDTEAYCLPFYLATTGQKVARELLIYRYNQLGKAIENAEKLGFKEGAALYPMVTINGEECHNEWEITFEEIHRNGAIAYAIYNYIRHTADRRYLAEYGLEVLIAIARFWSQRITWSDARKQYVMLGVTGPNEYENNVNNNWYTSYIGCWCMRYAAESAEWVHAHYPENYKQICEKCHFNEASECARWREIDEKMYLGEDKSLGIFLQQDGYLDKEQILVRDLDPRERPINQKWSWDRILRSCFIKQADVLQGLYFFQHDFDTETIRRNFHFYEQRTVHESSLSPCVHAILATKIGDMEKAYELYLRTSRLDLDDYNHEIDEGLHVTSMAGSWLSVVEGFGGVSVTSDTLTFAPALPNQWKSLSFNMLHRGRTLSVRISHTEISIAIEGEPLDVVICGQRFESTNNVIYNQPRNN